MNDFLELNKRKTIDLIVETCLRTTTDEPNWNRRITRKSNVTILDIFWSIIIPMTKFNFEWNNNDCETIRLLAQKWTNHDHMWQIVLKALASLYFDGLVENRYLILNCQVIKFAFLRGQFFVLVATVLIAWYDSYIAEHVATTKPVTWQNYLKSNVGLATHFPDSPSSSSSSSQPKK